MTAHELVATVLDGAASTGSGVPLDFSGPVSQEEIAAAERKLGVRFPNSYRVFLRHFGAGMVHDCDIFGLSRQDGFWGDVVAMNQLPGRVVPRHYVRFTWDVGDCCYYLDTSRMDAGGECPVIVLGPDEDGEIVADSFLDFLRQTRAGLL